jgi:outer membrane protein TolC
MGLVPWVAVAQEQPVGLDQEGLRQALAPEPGGLTADQASARAVEVSPSVAQRRAQVLQARESVLRTRDGFVPQVEVSATYTRLSEVDQPTINFGGMEISLFPQILNSTALKGTVTFPVSDYFLTLWPAYEGTQGFEEAARRQVEAARNKTWLDTREAFYDYINARGAVVVLEDAIKLLEANLSDLEAMRGAGLATEADVELLRAELENTRAERLRALGGVVVLRRNLLEQMDLPPDEELRIGEDLFAADPPSAGEDVEATISQALERRPEAQALRSLLTAQGHLMRSQGSGRLPRLFVQAGADYANPNQRITPPEEEFNLTWSVTAGVSWSLGEALGSQHDVNEAQQELVSLRADQEMLRRGIALEVTQAITNSQVARQSREASLQRLKAARESYRGQVLRQRAGQATTTEVLQARNQMQQAQLALLGSQVELRKAHARLIYATATIEQQ